MDKDLHYRQLIEENVGKIHISFSEFSKYQSCGHRHLIEKYLKLVKEETYIHLIFGNSVHKAIEHGIRDRSHVEDRVMMFREDFTKEMMDNMKDTPEFRDLESFLGQGENIIRSLSTEKILKNYEVIGVELPLYEKIIGIFHFKGFIDLILKDKSNGRILIVDWKTSGEQWDVSKKKKDMTFMAQMRLYKYFFAKKQGVEIDEIDCKYIVLNRLKSKKCPELGFGEIQPVEIFSDHQDIEDSITMVAEAVRDIHVKNYFPKAKFNNKTGNCYFCPYKKNFAMCDSDPEQYKKFLGYEI
jgi:hypothetical protein